MATPSFDIPARPPPLPVSRTCSFKSIPSTNTNILIDIYTPSSFSSVTTDHDPAPIVLFIHGGGWTGSNRSDYSRPLFQSFLDLGFVVASMDYRLIPESSHLEQLEDVADVEAWLREDLPTVLGDSKKRERKIVVVGASAGAQLALLTPKLWKEAPSALLILYAPTNMHILPYSGRGRLSALTIPPASHELLAEATDYESPPTEKAISKCALDYLSPRVVMSTHVFRDEIVAEVLLRGLKGGKVETGDQGETFWEDVVQLKLPSKGSVSDEEVNDISPLHVLLVRPSLPPQSQFTHPPTYLLTGTSDEMFSPADHTLPYYDELIRQNVHAEVRLVPGVGHAFDVWAEIGSAIAEDVIRPAVAWVGDVVSSDV